jgi:hypothetical protein
VQENIWDVASVRSQSRSGRGGGQDAADNAKRAVEQFHFPHEHANREDCQGQIERLLNKFGEGGDGQQFARHLLHTGSPTYRKAFGKAVGGSR